jgi:hypothetical protein
MTCFVVLTDVCLGFDDDATGGPRVSRTLENRAEQVAGDELGLTIVETL